MRRSGKVFVSEKKVRVQVLLPGWVARQLGEVAEKRKETLGRHIQFVLVKMCDTAQREFDLGHE